MKPLLSWIRLARFNWSSFTIICFIHQYPDTYRSDLTPGLDRHFKADARVVLGSRPRLGLIFARVCVCRQIDASTFAPSWSGIGQVARRASSKAAACARIAGCWWGSSACQRPGDLPALRDACRYSPVGFDRQQYLPSDCSFFSWLTTEIWMVILKNGMTDMIAVLCWHVVLLEIRFFEFCYFLSK